MDLDTRERQCHESIAEWRRVYALDGETMPDDAPETANARDWLTLIARVRAAEAERDRLRAELDDVESNEITRALAEQVHGAESGER